MSEKPLKLKLILVGHGKVGKTSLINQYINNEDTLSYIATMGADKSLKNINIEGKEVTLEIFDTVGQPDYRIVNKIFMKNTKIALIVYDITNRESFEELPGWINNVKEINQSSDIILSIIANKSDLYEERNISLEEGKKFAADNHCFFFETSAFDYESINKVFKDLTEEYLIKISDKKNSIDEKPLEKGINNIDQVIIPEPLDSSSQRPRCCCSII